MRFSEPGVASGYADLGRWLLLAQAWRPCWQAVVSSPADAAPQSGRQAGRNDGVWYWDLPVTPNGLRPLIAYSGAGSAPDGSI